MTAAAGTARWRYFRNTADCTTLRNALRKIDRQPRPSKCPTPTSWSRSTGWSRSLDLIGRKSDEQEGTPDPFWDMQQ